MDKAEVERIMYPFNFRGTLIVNGIEITSDNCEMSMEFNDDHVWLWDGFEIIIKYSDIDTLEVR